MKSRRLIIAVATLLVILAAYNVLIARAARTSQRQHMLTRLSQLPPETGCIFLGNSLVEAGCDVEAIKDSWAGTPPEMTAVNLALGATSPVEHYLILDQALRQPLKHAKYLVYGFFDDQLHSLPAGDWSDLVGNRALSYYFPEQAASLYAPGSRLKKWQLEFTRRVPMLAERSSLWSKVELLRNAIGDIGMPRHQFNRFGRVADFAALEPSDLAAFNRRCSEIVAAQQNFSAPIEQILRLAQAHNLKAVLLEMPMPSRHRDTFYSSAGWKELRTYVQNLAAQQRAAYIPASDWIQDDSSFEDATHLSAAGAKVFSARLASVLPSITESGPCPPALSTNAAR